MPDDREPPVSPTEPGALSPPTPDADTQAAPGGAVTGHPGPGGGGGDVGAKDLGGGGDVGGGAPGTEDDPLRTQTAGGSGAASD